MVAVTVRAPQAGMLTVYNVPTENLRASQSGILSTFMQIAQSLDVQVAGAMSAFLQPAELQVQQAGMLAVVRGRIANPALRVWTFTLDGHDFFVIRLGDTTTLLYDVYSEQWIDWDGLGGGAWRPNTGMTWIGGQALANAYGSAVVAGDDTFGRLWFLDPLLPWDENPNIDRGKEQNPFTRIVTGQVLANGRDNFPCYAIFVEGDNYGIVAEDFVPFVTLEYSDDQGRNFVSADTFSVDNATPYSWYSLGQISAPGRIFRVIDNGVLTRIDSVGMNDDAG